MGRPVVAECLRGHAYTSENTYINPQGKKECRKCGVAATLRSQCRRIAAETDVDRATRLMRKVAAKLGLTPYQLEVLIMCQGATCGICGAQAESEGEVYIDHDHLCCSVSRGCRNCVRGVLCRDCNNGIGLFNDDPECLYFAARWVHGK